MKTQHTDLTFFTNDRNQTLLDRFKATLADTRLFDVLVGYFRASGFYQLCDSLESIGKTRILVGLGIDDESYRAVDAFRAQAVLDFESHKNTKNLFQETLIKEIEDSEETDARLELGLNKFIQFFLCWPRYQSRVQCRAAAAPRCGICPSPVRGTLASVGGYFTGFH
jgi:hypothetical protein